MRKEDLLDKILGCNAFVSLNSGLAYRGVIKEFDRNKGVIYLEKRMERDDSLFSVVKNICIPLEFISSIRIPF